MLLTELSGEPKFRELEPPEPVVATSGTSSPRGLGPRTDSLVGGCRVLPYLALHAWNAFSVSAAHRTTGAFESISLASICAAPVSMTIEHTLPVERDALLASTW